MTNRKVFLTARWENLIIISYKVNPEILEPYMPRGLEADTIDGNAFVSLVAFDFLDTKVKGMKYPFHINFPEINLRFYVKNKQNRGVVFIREFVPRSLIAFFANMFYNENYRAIQMTSHIERNSKILLNHTINLKGKRYQISVEALNKPHLPQEGSTEHFFKEHEWGFGTSRNQDVFMYKVEHPFWEVYTITMFEHNFDFSAIYGQKWEKLNKESPFNVVLAKGSSVKVFAGSKLK
jgi:uncharacterized protein YqjF (DUF2071 family)